MFKLVLEEAEGPGSNCQHLLDHRKSKRVPENTYFCFIDYAKAFDCVDHNKLWETLQEMGIPDTLPASCQTCMQVKKQQLESDMEQQTGSKLGKEYVKTVYCHPAYLTYAEYIMWNARLDEAQDGIKIARRNISNLSYADDTTLMTEGEEEPKSLLIKSEGGDWKSWLKAQHSEN